MSRVNLAVICITNLSPPPRRFCFSLFVRSFFDPLVSGIAQKAMIFFFFMNLPEVCDPDPGSFNDYISCPTALAKVYAL